MTQPEGKAEVINYAGPAAPRSIPVAEVIAPPIGWPFATFLAITTGLTLYANSGPVPYSIPSSVALACWFTTIAWWAWRGAAGFVDIRRRRSFGPFPWRRYVAVPVILASVGIVVALDVPFSIAFGIARPSLDQKAAAMLRLPKGTTSTTNIGIFGNCTFTRINDSVVVEVATRGLDSYGFFYSPSGAGVWNRPLGGNWFRWYRRY
jgi:hypothetical protein